MIDVKKNCMEKYQAVCKKMQQSMRKHTLERFFSKNVKQDVEELSVPIRSREKLYAFYTDKFMLSLGIFVCSIVLAGIVLYNGKQQNLILQDEKGLYAVREDPSGEERKVPVRIVAGTKETKGELILSEQKYSREEFEEKCEEIIETIPERIKGENESLEKVSSQLNLKIEHIAPLLYEWRMDDYTYISSDGMVDVANLETSQAIVTLTLQLSYETYEYEYSFPIILVPKKMEKTFEEEILDFLWKDQQQYDTQKKYYFPSSWNQQTVSVTEEKKPYALWVMLFGSIVSIFLFFAKNKDLHTEIEERREQLLREYPEFVSKLMLYMGAGMTTKGALYQLTSDYKKKMIQRTKERNYLYEELNYMMHALENGVFEQEAYEHFGKRTKVVSYQKLMSILAQNNKKGTDNLLQILDREAKESFTLRKNEAKRLGEKAGTKLLLPMTLMLGIVMIIIIVPAFLSYDI